MLNLKEKLTKKTIIYIAIIIIIVGGAGFMLYRNRIASRKDSTADTQSSAAILKSKTPADQSAKPESLIKSSELDLTIFQKEKFRDLKENILMTQEKSDLGKRDIFKPN